MSLAVEKRPFRSGCWALQTWLKNNAEDCGMGYMAHVKNIPGPKAINYVTKYLTKELQDIDIKGLRRVQTSSGIGAPGQEKQEGWKVTDFITARDFRPGAKVLDLNTGEIIGNDHWEVHSLYPWEA
jgi:hypothetical protein